MRITVLGSGTSVGVPAIGCNCPVCCSDRPENKRLRCSIYIEHQQSKFLIDCSYDFRQQAIRYGLQRVDAVLFTHDHADHTNGIDDLRVFNYMQNGPIDLYGDSTVLDTIRKRYEYCFNPRQIGGGIPQLSLKQLRPLEPLHLNGLAITPIPVKHGILDILGFRIGPDFAYLTDCSEIPEQSAAALQGIKVLILDALRHRPHPTHFNIAQALDFSRKIAPEQTWFTHTTCDLDYFETNASLPANAQLLKDGQVIEIDGA